MYYVVHNAFYTKSTMHTTVNYKLIILCTVIHKIVIILHYTTKC